ncbi:MAG: hypothetical protein HP053_00295 [Christensenellaceae bacterium]|nr:hypothetical protein [Christensenellaceae bacterium]
MSRKTLIYQVPAQEGNRDAGKRFLIEEMPATRAERWAMRALLALMGGNVELGDIRPGHGMAGLMSAGLEKLAALNWETVQPLYDELLECVYALPKPDNDAVRVRLTPAQADTQVEEISTLLALRVEALGLHVGFSLGDALATLIARSAAGTSSSASTSPS